MSRLGILVGMRSEARAIARVLPRATLIEVGGAEPARTRLAVCRLLARGATHLISLGLAGALVPSLRPGNLVAPTRIRGPDGQIWPTDGAWRARLQLAPAVHEGLMLGSDRAIGSAAEKAACHRETGAIAVDMESHLLAAAAEGHPLLVLRAVADPAERTLPQAALIALRANGTPDLRAVMTELARHPAQLGPLIRLALDARAAHAALSGVARLVGDRLFP